MQSSWLCRVKIMYNHINPKNNQPAPLIAEDVYNIIRQVQTTPSLNSNG